MYLRAPILRMSSGLRRKTAPIAAAFGILQMRERLFTVAVLDIRDVHEFPDHTCVHIQIVSSGRLDFASTMLFIHSKKVSCLYLM